jgi:hypothetical protein
MNTIVLKYKSLNKLKVKSIFRINMTFIYSNSILFFLELCDPMFGYFHGLMLSIGLFTGWGLHGIIGSIVHKTIYRIYKIKGSDNIKIEYLGFYKVF